MSAHSLAIEVERLKSRLNQSENRLEKALQELGDLARFLEEAEQQAKSAWHQHHQQQQRAERLSAEIAALRASSSWRITAPLRYFIDKLRGLTKRHSE